MVQMEMSMVYRMMVTGLFAAGMSLASFGLEVDCGATRVAIDDATGRIGGICSADGSSIAKTVETVYFAMTKDADIEAFEGEDEVVEKTAASQGGVKSTVFRCRNRKLPGVTIVKRYRPYNGGLRRTIEFRGETSLGNTVYVTPFMRCTFADGFKDGLWHLGAGYIGPFRPFPDVEKPQVVNKYVQSSKGLVLTHPNGTAGDFAHYRVLIDDTVVLPWFHSSIGHYREYHDRLWYLPDGYKMGLGTFDVRPGKSVSVTDQFTAFRGGVFGFFDDVFGRDADVRREIDSIPAAPQWMQNLACIVWNTVHDDFVRWLTEMMDEGEFIVCAGLFNSWGDYRFDPATQSLQGFFGGRLTRDETREYYRHLRAFAPGRVHANCYQIVISAGEWTRVLKEHPEWFRMRDRDGNIDSLFPGCCRNFQTLFSNPHCRNWMVDMLSAFAGDTGSDVCYTDETQMTNTIDWEKDVVTRDDDCVKFWRMLKKRLHSEGVTYFANGSGLPYADLNYMESPKEMKPAYWRDWAGVALGIGLVNRMKPGNRTAPLYWTRECDYVNRFLALGWVPCPYWNELCLMAIRAQWQCGHMVPVNVAFTPDWKRDFATEIEGHANVRVDCRDVVLSFINRGKARDVPVTVDLSTLGFGADERINVWKGHFDETLAKRSPILADRDLRSNWRGEGSIDGASLYRPELVYSGPAKGVFADTVVGLGENRMEQYLATPAPVQLFAANDVPLNQYYTSARGCKVEGRRVTNERRVDVLLADKDMDFCSVTANGVEVPVRRIELWGRVFALVTLEPGAWELRWREMAAVDTQERKDVTALPAKPRRRESSVRHLKYTTVEPDRREKRLCLRKVDGAEIVETYEWTSECVCNSGVQTNLKPAQAVADSAALRLVAGPTRREAVKTSNLKCWAGFRMKGAKRLKLRFRHTLQEAHGSHLGYTYPWGWGTYAELFTGLVLDYHCSSGFVKRVSLSTGLFSDRCIAVFPWWGAAKGARESENLLLGEWVESPAEREFVLDLSRYAPAGWDGEVVLSLGEEKLGAGRHLELEVLGVNDGAVGAEAVARTVDSLRDPPPPAVLCRLRQKPRSMGTLYSEEWARWTPLAGKFTRIERGVAKKGTTVRVAHDKDFLYVGVCCEEDDRGPQATSMDPYQNEHIEVCLVRPDGRTIQFLGDVKGRVSCFLAKAQVAVPAGTVCRGENCAAWSAGWRVFFAIPLKAVGLDGNDGRRVIRANVCRCRIVGEPELTTWAPMAKKSFLDVPNYGTWIIDPDKVE